MHADVCSLDAVWNRTEHEIAAEGGGSQARSMSALSRTPCNASSSSSSSSHLSRPQC